MRPKIPVTIALAACIAASSVAFAAEADARVRRGQASVETQRGVYQGQSRVERTRGHRSREASVIGPNGRQSSVSDDRSWNRQQGTYSHDRQRIFANGDTRSVEADAQRTAPGEWSAQRSVVGRNGETRTQSGTFNAERTENGRAISGDIQTSNAGQVDYQRQVSRGPDGRSVTASATFEDGSSVSRSTHGACDGAGTCSRDTVLTDRAGQSTQIEEQRTRTENGAIYQRDTTFADGSQRSVDRERAGNGDGSGVFNRRVVGRNGQTREQNGAYSVSREPH